MGCETASWEVLGWIIWRTKSQCDSYRPEYYVSELWSILWPLIHNKHAERKLKFQGFLLHQIPAAFYFYVAGRQAWRATYPVSLSENVFLSSCVFIWQKQWHTQTRLTHTLPTWLLEETTPVGVLCFHNDSKDDLESAEKGAEWERGWCNKIVSNELRRSVCSLFTDSGWYFQGEVIYLCECVHLVAVVEEVQYSDPFLKCQ